MRFVVVVLGAALLLSSCNLFDRPSEDYQKLTSIPPRQWVDFASELPVRRRLDLYEEVYDRSPHPPDTRLSPAFSQDPEASYGAITERMQTGRSPDRYYPILFQIEQESHETMCRNGRRAFIEKTLMRGQETHPFSGLFSTPCG